MNLKLLLSIYLMTTLSCNQANKQMSFYKAPQLTQNSTVDGKKYYREVIFILNPVESLSALNDSIKKYNRFHTSKDDMKLKYDFFVREFYRESGQTPIDFVEDQGGFVSNRLEDHEADLLGSYSMERCFNVNTNGKFENVEWKVVEKKSDNMFKIYYEGIPCK